MAFGGKKGKRNKKDGKNRVKREEKGGEREKIGKNGPKLLNGSKVPPLHPQLHPHFGKNLILRRGGINKFHYI